MVENLRLAIAVDANQLDNLAVGAAQNTVGRQTERCRRRAVRISLFVIVLGHRWQIDRSVGTGFRLTLLSSGCGDNSSSIGWRRHSLGDFSLGHSWMTKENQCSVVFVNARECQSITGRFATSIITYRI